MQKIVYANSLFEQPWWLNLTADNQWKEYFSYDKDDNIIGRVAIVEKKGKICMPSMTQTLGIWIEPKFRNNLSESKKIINDLLEQFPYTKSIDIRLNPKNKYVLPFIWKGFNISPAFTFRINDLTDLEALYNNFGKTAKKNIKAAKNKVTISNDLNIETIWEMLDKTFRAQKRSNPMSKELIINIINFCEKNNCGQYFEARDKNNVVHSCGYFVYDQEVCYYLLGASDTEYRSSGAQSLVLWEGIQFAAKNSKIFDFEGSMIEGIENFFKQFGSECEVYYRITKKKFWSDFWDLLKPKIKKIIGYKV